jgi:glycosyltransferase involved in cell wall biosynthesis
MKNWDVLKHTAAKLKDIVDLRIATNLPRSAMPDFYRGLDVLVVCSRSEGGPLPLMEALCCGIPVVTTHVGLADVHIQHGHNGWFFDGEEAELTRRLKWLARNPNAIDNARYAAANTPFIRWPDVTAHWQAFFDSVT